MALRWLVFFFLQLSKIRRAYFSRPLYFLRQIQMTSRKATSRITTMLALILTSCLCGYSYSATCSTMSFVTLHAQTFYQLSYKSPQLPQRYTLNDFSIGFSERKARTGFSSFSSYLFSSPASTVYRKFFPAALCREKVSRPGITISLWVSSDSGSLFFWVFQKTLRDLQEQTMQNCSVRWRSFRQLAWKSGQILRYLYSLVLRSWQRQASMMVLWP